MLVPSPGLSLRLDEPFGPAHALLPHGQSGLRVTLPSATGLARPRTSLVLNQGLGKCGRSQLPV